MSATNRGAYRQPNDFYETPAEVAKAMIDRIDWTAVSSVCEPCRGGGAIYNLLPDSVTKHWYEISEGRNYLQTATIESSTLTLTNPPYFLAEAFIEKALAHSQTCIFLLRINFLESQRRYPFWQRNPITHLITLSKRPSFTGRGTDATGYAWFCWDRIGLVKGPTFQWIVP